MGGRFVRIAAAAAALALGLAALPSTSVALSPPALPPTPRRLHATSGPGARIVDDLGRQVILRGVNVNALGEYYQEFSDLPTVVPLTEQDFADMAAMGFGVVRLLITWSSLEPTPGQISTATLDRIQQAVGWARNHNIHVLLDMHQDAWGPHVDTPDGVTCPPQTLPAIGWDGAPAWATQLVGTVATCRASTGREFSPAVAASFQAFYADAPLLTDPTGPGIQQHLVDTWGAVAKRFAADPTVVGYDLLNEPNPGLAGGVDDYALLGSYYDRALQAIRAAEASVPGGFSHIGFFEPSVITGPLAVPGPLPGFSTDDNLVYAPHLYNGSISPLPGSIEQGFANAATAASTYGTTFFSGEWGWFGDNVVDQPNIERYARAEDTALVGGTWWQWKQACGDPHAVGVRRNRPGCAGKSTYSGGLVVRSRANTMVLDRAYVRAGQGELMSMTADVATGGLAVNGVADKAGSIQLWVPSRCTTPRVTGTNVGTPGIATVTGGYRVELVVPNVAPYEVTVACGATASGPGTPGVAGTAADGVGGSLPATGGSSASRWALGLAAVGLAASRARRRIRR